MCSSVGRSVGPLSPLPPALQTIRRDRARKARAHASCRCSPPPCVWEGAGVTRRERSGSCARPPGSRGTQSPRWPLPLTCSEGAAGAGGGRAHHADGVGDRDEGAGGGNVETPAGRVHPGVPTAGPWARPESHLRSLSQAPRGRDEGVQRRARPRMFQEPLEVSVPSPRVKASAQISSSTRSFRKVKLCHAVQFRQKLSWTRCWARSLALTPQL